MTTEMSATLASQVQRALASGLTEAQVVALVAARHAWQVLGQLDPTTLSEDLLTALRAPGAGEFDAIFVRRARMELSLPTPSVSPCPT